MKTKLFILTLIGTCIITPIQAQNYTQINAINFKISADLDLSIVATLFGEAKNLEDFEMRLNDPELEVSNLDLNNDNRVDYLRVVESIENNSHFVLIQAVVDRDIYQDVVTINVEKNNYNSIKIQIIGNRNLYGTSFIYKPVYYRTPTLLSLFWNSNYRAYYSNWKWNYYPKHYYSWQPHNHPTYRQKNPMNYSRKYNYKNDYYSKRNDDNYKADKNRYTNSRPETISRRTSTAPEHQTNKPLEIREVEIERRNTQFVTIPQDIKNQRNSRRNSIRN